MMKKRIIPNLLAICFVISLACSTITNLAATEEGQGEDGGPTADPMVATGNGPQRLTAVATSADSVLLTWQPVEGVSAYHVLVSEIGDEALDVVALSPESTSYEDFMAPPDSQLIYAVEAVGDSGSIGQSIVNVTTPARVPNPISVQPQYDENATVLKSLGPAGGSIFLTGPDGTVFELILPAGAIPMEFELGMTPITGIEDWPLDGEMLAAVRLEPEGFPFDEIATLNITLPGDLAEDEKSIVGFECDGAGQEFHIEPAYQDLSVSFQPPFTLVHLAKYKLQTSNAISVPANGTTVKGVGQTSSGRAGELVKNHPPSDVNDARDQKRAAQNSDVKRTLNNWESEIVMDGMEVAKQIMKADDCESLNSAIVAFQKWGYKAGTYERSGRVDHQIIKQADDLNWSELKKKTKEMLEKLAEDCEKQGEGGQGGGAAGNGNDACGRSIYNNLTSERASGFWGLFQTQMLNSYGVDWFKEIEEKLEKCKKKAYEFHGNIDDASLYGKTCDSSKTFHAAGSFQMTFTPVNEKMGTYVYTGPMSARGTGPYLFRTNGGMLVMGTGCVLNFCKTYSHNWTATPLDPDTCVP
jgi:hypothetical protein